MRRIMKVRLYFSVPRAFLLTKDDADLISVADDAEIYIIPLVWTLSTDGQSFEDYAVPIMNAVVEAVKSNPNPVLAVALGECHTTYKPDDLADMRPSRR